MAGQRTHRLDSVRALFVDDAIIAESSAAKRRLHQLTKDPREPIMHSDRPWEGYRILAYGSVWPRDGQLRMWYLAQPGMPDDRRYYTIICLATSTDGIHWEKPPLYLYDYWGNKANNICILPHWKSEKSTGRLDTVSIIQDDTDPNPLRRYKMMTQQYAMPDKWKSNQTFPSGYYVAFSPDGLHWQEKARPVFRLDEGIGDCQTTMHDTRRGRYTAFVKILSPTYGMQPRRRMTDVGQEIWDGKKWIVPTGENPVRRMRGISHSDDFIHWSATKFILPTDDEDPPDAQFYNNTGFVYESLYLGFVYVYHVQRTGCIDMQLIWSRDGEDWHRAFDRTPILPSGTAERDWDMGCHAMFSNPPIRAGDELWFYYGSTWGRHGGGNLKLHHGPSGTALGRAKIRVDGFVSMDAGERTARLTTQPLQLASSALCVNSDAAGGSVRAQVLRRGRPIPGFDFASCEPLTVDQTRHVFRFKGGKLPRSAAPVRVEFAFSNASIYSFWTEPLPPRNL